MSKVSDTLREEWGRNDQKRDFGLTTPAYIIRYDDMQYGENSLWNVLDVYRPRYREGKLPVIMIVHGGGWVYGCKELYQFYGMELARRGFAVVNYTYRLAPEHKFPAHLEDAVSVCSWIMKNAETYGLDTENIFAVGDSAGGHLLGLLSAFLTDPEYRKNFAFQAPEGFSLRAVGMNCGAYRIYDENGTADRPDDDVLMKDFLPEGGSAKERELIDVVSHVNKDFPPAYIMSCEGDFLLAQAPMLHEAYRKAGAESELYIFGSKDHPLYHVFHVTVQEKEGQRCNDEECEFFRRHMAD